MTPHIRLWIGILSFITCFQGYGQEAVEQATPSYTIADTVEAKRLITYAKNQLKFQKGELALENAKKALVIYEQVLEGDSNEEAAALRMLGGAYYQLQNIGKAKIYWDSSFAMISQIHGPETPQLAACYSDQSIYYLSQEMFDLAIKSADSGLSLLSDFPDKFLHTKGALYNNLGSIHFQRGSYTKAESSFNDALNIFNKHFTNFNPYRIAIYNNLGGVLQAKGDFEKSIDYYEKAYSIVKQFSVRLPITADLLSNQAISYQSKGDFKKAFGFFKESLKIRQETLGEPHFRVAQSLSNIGNTYYLNNDTGKAIEYFSKSLEMYQKLGQENNNELASTYNNAGLPYQKMGNFNKAIEYHKKALEMYKNIYEAKHPLIGYANYNIAKCHQLSGNETTADRFYNKALQSINYQSIDSLQSVFSMPLLIKTFASLAQIQKEKALKYNCAECGRAASLYHTNTLSALNHIQKSYSPDTKLSLAAEYQDIFVEMVSTEHLLFLNNKNNLHYRKRFELAERSKSMALFEAMTNSKALSFANIPEPLIKKEYDLRIDITYYDKKKQEQIEAGLLESDSIVLSISAKLFDFNQEYEKLKKKFERDYPQYYKAKYDLSTISLNEVQNNLLKKNQSLLEYMVGDSSIFIFLVQKDTFEIHEIKHDFPLEDWVSQMTQDGIYGYHTKTKEKRGEALETSTIANYTTAAQKIYEKLVAPVSDQLKEEVLIIPDGVLGYIPFEALLTEAPPREGVFRAYPYLIKKHQISYCYSATLLNEMRNKRHKQTPPGTLLAMAPFFQDDIEELVSSLDTTDLLADITLRDSLGALRGSGEEVASINTLWKGTPTYGAEASLEHFQQNAANYQVIHLSTHGKADDRVGDYAYLAFSNPDEKSTFDKLYARDLYNYSLNADMVVLSACETGTGKLQKGEGIVSLARAFAYAGAKSIFSTLWKVNDEKTKDLMVYFYANLKKGQDKGEALRNAKLKYLKKNKGVAEALHPFFWAGMIGIGDMTPIRF